MKGKKAVLTDQELEIMKIVWQLGTATVREVYEELLKSRKIAYTTVMTMMGILEQKGRLKKTARERAYVYSPTEAQGEVVRPLRGGGVGGGGKWRIHSGNTMNQEALHVKPEKPSLFRLLRSHVLSGFAPEVTELITPRRAPRRATRCP